MMWLRKELLLAKMMWLWKERVNAFLIDAWLVKARVVYTVMSCTACARSIARMRQSSAAVEIDMCHASSVQ